MSRSLCLTLAASLSLLTFNLAPAQTESSAPATTEQVAKLQAENAKLKKEVSDASQTITKLQAQLAEANARPAPAPAPAPVATDAPVPAPAGPQKALPLDSTNAVDTAATPGAPGSPATDAGPSKTYTVVKGDSIWKIAHKMYKNDTKNGVEKIQEANKDAIGGKPLKIGQVLVIPQ